MRSSNLSSQFVSSSQEERKEMKKLFTIAIAAILVLSFSALGFAGSKDQTFTGEIMDSQCAKMGSHDMMIKQEGAKDAKQCTLGCVKMGGKYVLFNAADKTIYQLDDQTKPEAFAGEKVSVKGKLDKDKKTIHVTGIQAGS
jgi:hypothetical protein